MLSIVAKDQVLARIAELELDASLDESHSFENAVTQFPVEDQSDITDHIRNRPIKLTLQGFVTNHPIREVTTTSEGVRDTDVPNRAQLAFRELLRIYYEKQPVSVITGLQVYPKMALVSLLVPRNATIGESLRFTAEMLEIITVSTETVDATNLLPVKGTEKQAPSKKDKGKQTSKKATDQQEKTIATLYRLARLLGL